MLRTNMRGDYFFLYWISLSTNRYNSFNAVKNKYS